METLHTSMYEFCICIFDPTIYNYVDPLAIPIAL